MRGISYDEMGSGVKIGILAAFDAPFHDAHVLQSHETLRHQFPFPRNCVIDRCAEDTMTGLASVAVGRRPSNSSRSMFGVAPGASLSYTVNRRYEKTDDSLNQALQLMLNYIDVDILIIPSWGASNLMDDYDDYLGDRPSTRAATLRENIADTIFVTDVGGPSTYDSALEGLYDIEDNVAFVMSSRDNTSDTCEAVGRNADKDHSNCITVPHLVSGQFAADDNTNGQSYARYTENLSSGIVGGGLAVMKQMFRGQLSNTALVSRLLQTADKSGKYGSRQYGNGLMDLGAATNPWGVLSMGTRSSSVGSSSVSLDSTSLSLGAPLGGGLPAPVPGAAGSCRF